MSQVPMYHNDATGSVMFRKLQNRLTNLVRKHTVLSHGVGSFLCLDRWWELAQSKGPHRKSVQGYHAHERTHSPRTPQ